MSAFHEVRFPVRISVGSTGGPEWRTEIATLDSGFEMRNGPWSEARRRYDASLGVRSATDAKILTEFFNARRGRLHGFRWRDTLDCSSSSHGRISPTDQALGYGDGAQTEYQLVKRATSGGALYVREIRKPVEGSLRVAVDGTELSSGWTADPTTGRLTFASPPSSGSVVTAGFLFDVPVRFDTDALSIRIDGKNVVSIPSIPVVELRL